MSNARPLNGVVGASERVVMVVGNYGSGKTEAAVNLALHLAKAGRRVQIADLDIVNPYFRSREARRLMEQHGIRVVVPPGDQAFADLPIILPEIRGMLNPPEGVLTLFDVGGDDVGARVLSAFRPTIREGSYQLWQVINARRPFTSTVEGCMRMQASIESASRLTVTGLLANTHLIEQTTPEIIVEGWRLAEKVAGRCGRPVRCVAVMEEHASDPAMAEVTAPVLRMKRTMLPPWIQTDEPADDVPAARSVPIGKPPQIQFPRPRGERHG
jgi:hypothetical protein